MAHDTDASMGAHSLHHELDEIGRRMQPDEVRAELKDALRRKIDPEPYLGWIATSLVAIGALMAYRGWRRARHVEPVFAGVDCCTVML